MSDTTLTYYNNNGKSVAERYESADVADLQDFLLKSFSPPAKLLELGCGSGRDAAFMTGHGFQVTAVDGSSTMIDSALKFHPELSDQLHTVVLPDGLEGIQGEYEGIFTIATLMHLSRKDINITLEKIKHLLVSRGRLFFSVPVKRDDTDNTEFDGKGRRFTALTKADWINLCQQHGFRQVKSMETQDGLDRPGIIWMNCLMEKTE